MPRFKRKKRAIRAPRHRHECSACGKEVAFCWHCTCGFALCQRCMEENLWGMTCNWVTWTCPDCGASRSF